ncbi:MAG: hypothetical protein RSC82_07775, partial [Oscillospiraceae bacterium]
RVIIKEEESHMQAAEKKEYAPRCPDNVIDFTAYRRSLEEEKPEVDRVPIIRTRRRHRTLQLGLLADYCATGGVVLFVMVLIGKMMTLG